MSLALNRVMGRTPRRPHTSRVAGTKQFSIGEIARVWHDFSNINGYAETAGKISQINDLTGNGSHATQASGAAQGDLLQGAQNGRDVMDAGSGACFYDYGTGLDFLATDANHMVFAAIKVTGNYSNLYGAANGGSGDQSLHVGFQNSSKFRINRWGNDSYPNIQPEFDAAGYNVCEWHWPVGASKEAWQNGTVSPTTGPNASTLSAMAGGGRLLNVVGQGFLQCELGEFIIVNSVSASLAAMVRNYLRGKWGTP